MLLLLYIRHLILSFLSGSLSSSLPKLLINFHHREVSRTAMRRWYLLVILQPSLILNSSDNFLTLNCHIRQFIIPTPYDNICLLSQQTLPQVIWIFWPWSLLIITDFVGDIVIIWGHQIYIKSFTTKLVLRSSIPCISRH